MRGKNHITIGILVVTALLVIGAIAQIMNSDDESRLSIETRSIEGHFYSMRDMPLDVVFKNNGDEVIRLLDVFSDPKLPLILFTVDVRDANGTPIDTLGGGKIALSKDSMKYIVLASKADYKVQLNLKDFLPKDTQIKAGNYNVAVTYTNKYGDDCFKGTVVSNALSLYLNEPYH